MGRRIRWLALAVVLAFALVLAQLLNIDQREASSLNAARTNPRNFTTDDNRRGLILAADGQVLAESVKIPHAKGYQYYRTYPTGELYSDYVGFTTPFYGSRGVERVYSKYLALHTQPVTTIGQLLNPPGQTTDNVSMTVVPSLQSEAAALMGEIPSANQDGAIVVENVTTGAILAMFSNPTYTNNALATPDLATPDFTKEQAAFVADTQTPDHEGFLAYPPLAYWDPLFPGSTFKVVTSMAVYNLKPTLAGFTFKISGCTGKTAIEGTTHQICNDATTPTAANPCGGTLTQMLPESCDPGYAMLGVHLGGTTLYDQAALFGYDSVPPIDEYPVQKSNFPTPKQFAPTKTGPAGLALAAFGQGTVTSTALQGVMVAQGIADTGKVMVPHVASRINDSSNGALVKTISPTLYKQAASPAAAQSVNKLMQLVVKTGTAAGVGFPATENVAVKTGTAQAGTNLNNDWMIGFAPATSPRIAIAVVVPEQARTSGAQIAGPIFKAMMADALSVVTSRTTTPTPATPITGPVVHTTTGTGGPPPTTTTVPTATTTTTEQGAPTATTTTTTASGTTTTTSTAPPATTTTTAPPATTTTSGATATTAATAAVARSDRPPTADARLVRRAPRWRWASTGAA